MKMGEIIFQLETWADDIMSDIGKAKKWNLSEKETFIMYSQWNGLQSAIKELKAIGNNKNINQ